MLTETKLKKMKPKKEMYRVADENGLYIEVRKTGKLFWRMRYRFECKQKSINLGEYPLISLKDARVKRDYIRLKLYDGIDPITEKHEKQEEKKRSEEHMFSVVME